MAVTVTHTKVSLITDSANTNLVRPSDWNAAHTVNQATGKLLGRTTAGTGATEEISAGEGLILADGELTGTIVSETEPTAVLGGVWINPGVAIYGGSPHTWNETVSFGVTLSNGNLTGT